LPCDDATIVATTLQESLLWLGYTPFNPFGLMPGLSYPKAVRLFVAPAQGGWVRVIGEPDNAQLPIVSKTMLCLLVALDGTEAQIEVYADGERQPLDVALRLYLKSDIPAETPDQTSVSSQRNPRTGDLELLEDALPEDIKAMRVDMRQAQKMFDRLCAGLTQRSGNTGNEAAVRNLLQANRPQWDSAGGLQVRELFARLTIPTGWQEPDFVTLRDAYQLHERRRRNPNASLYPGDEEAMAAVPNALDYIVVYAGKG
jgi:hypothetical protein